MTEGPPAGWYDDPQMVNTRRYWDGAAWTDHRQEKPAVPIVASKVCPYCSSPMAVSAVRCPACSGELKFCPKDSEWVGVTGKQKFVGIARGGTKTQYRCMKCGRVVDGPRF